MFKVTYLCRTGTEPLSPHSRFFATAEEADAFASRLDARCNGSCVTDCEYYSPAMMRAHALAILSPAALASH